MLNQMLDLKPSSEMKIMLLMVPILLTIKKHLIQVSFNNNPKQIPFIYIIFYSRKRYFIKSPTTDGI